jgi:dephospho-CoA kinase
MTKIIGITGGIGMGKTETAIQLASLGIPSIDSDDLSRKVVEPETNAWRVIVQRFGRECLNEDQTLNRSYIADIIFTIPSEKSWIESIIHPEIRELRQIETNRIIQTAAKGSKRILVAWIVPLLFENQLNQEVESVICVACSRTNQIKRLSSRNWSESEMTRRIKSQWPVEKKMQLSDFVIWNDFSLDILQRQLSLTVHECSL